MATPRLPFLYPQFFRSIRTYESGARPFRFQPSSAGFHATRQRDQGAVSRRSVQSLESKLPPPTQQKKKSVKGSNGSLVKKDIISKTQNGAAAQQELMQTQDNASSASERNDNSSHNVRDGDKDTVTKDSKISDNPVEATTKDEAQSEAPKNTSEQKSVQEDPPPQNPMESVLQMPSASDMGLMKIPTNGYAIPHLEPAPYIHHFDTYTLVKNLQAGGFSDEQAITVMKAIRGILQEKLDLAEDTLTSKSDSGNEEYLFKAACSELRSSLEAARGLEIERQRTSRTHLQHEVDILSLRINQQIAKMNDDLKGMWNDHKMTTRELQQIQDTGIQELNYKIAVSLASDGKSEAEGLRWVLTRRAAFAIIFGAVMAITFLRFYSLRTHELERKQAVAKEAAKAEPTKDSVAQIDPPLSDTPVSESLG